MSTRIGVQLYTLRGHCKDVESFTKTCAWIAGQGVREVQVSAVGIENPTEIRAVLDAHDLVCTVTHRGLDALRDVDATLAYHRALGCNYAAVGGYFDKAAEGLQLGYHNHSHEFAPFADDPAQINPKDNPMWMLFERCSSNVWFEIDTYWVAHGGADPADWIDRVTRRHRVEQLQLLKSRFHLAAEHAGQCRLPHDEFATCDSPQS